MSKIGSVLIVVGAVLGVVALLMSWWSINLASSGFDVSLDFGLFQATSRVVDNGAVTVDAEDYSQLANVGRVMMTGTLLLVAAIAMGLAGAAAALFGGARPKARKVGAILAIVGAILAFASMASVMASLPGALTADTTNGAFPVNGFWGSLSQAGATLTWGAGFGWYLAAVAGILLILGGLLALRSPAPAPMAPGYAPYGYPGYAPPAPGMPTAPPYPGYQEPPPQPAPPTPPMQAPPAAPPAPQPAPAAPPAPPPPVAGPTPPPPGPGFCANCGTQLPGPVKFCGVCGALQAPGP